ncbi:FecR family protein [Parapedobacter indicus]|uniref:FecR family protein n=1 Tax=Parapedobacter indicus TaxID=1477437 RepID=UPI000B856A50|nr:FecR domain-containing protein [Parapedobacter indicus]PPL03771.1 FecR family protein [Parapedobacter indicus]
MDKRQLRIEQILRRSQWTEEDVRWMAEYLRHADQHELETIASILYADDLQNNREPLDIERSSRLLEGIHKRIQPKRSRLKRLRGILPYVAAMFLIAIVTSYFIVVLQLREGPAIADVQPGGNRATLTLGDGRTIDLSEKQDGIIVDNGISYLDGSTVLSEQVNEGIRVGGKQHLTLTTPKGGTYQIKLPDGTVVWLNAASILKYPSRFDGNERVIELEGEAYFDVAIAGAQHVPFKVIAHGQVIEVLGTEFNVSAYADDPETKTTLVEGNVRVKAVGSGGTNLSSSFSYLKPGQQAVTRGSFLDISEVDIFDYTAWRDGMIVLNGARLADVMRQVERWYDVVVDVPVLKTNKTAYVIINRNENLSSVLKALEETYQVKLKLEGRRVGIIE